MRIFLIIISLLAILSSVYCRKLYNKEKFVIVVNDDNDQSTTSSAIENTVKPTEQNIALSRYKSKRNDIKKKWNNSSNNNNTKNATDSKIMFKFEAKDGRMKFQRDVDDSKTPESQTESYEPIAYETDYKPKEPHSLTYFQHPATYYRLCPVHYTGNHAVNQGYLDHQVRNPKQSVHHVPISDPFTRYPSNYESGLNQQHQYIINQQMYGNNPSFGYQMYHPAYYGQQSYQSGSEQENIYGYGNGQNNYISHNLGSDNKLKSAYYTDYGNGIDAHQSNLNGVQQSYVYVPMYDPRHNSQYYTNNYNTDEASLYYKNIYSNSYNGYAPEYGNGFNQNPQGSFVDPTTGSYQINVGNKYTDTSNSNNYALDGNKYNINNKNTDNQITQVKYVNGPGPNMALNNYQSNQSENMNYLLSNVNKNYYPYTSYHDTSNPSVFESLKINVNQQTQPQKI